MNSTRLSKLATGLALGLATLAVAAPSFAQVYDLAAVEGTWTAPDGVTTIPMWGFVPDTGGSCPAAGAWATPAPLTAAAGATLTINLRNCLSVPASVFIPGQLKATVPVTFTDAEGRTRVRSFDAETAPGAVGIYTWDNVKEGTYLIQSGTHPQVQVQMGLYGSLIVTGGTYPVAATEQVLLYSEIDPALHAAVNGGTYGTPAYPSTFDYRPAYYLINGEAYPNTADLAVDTSADVLLRFVNAGLKTRSPALGGGLYMTLYAEDGNLYPFTMEQYGLELPPAKTIDAVLNVGADGTYALFDRSLGLMNGSSSGGGALAYITAGAAAGAPTALNDAYSVDEDAVLAEAAPGVLVNDTAGSGGAMTAALVADAAAGSLTFNADGSFTYTPNADFNGSDQFTYVANDGGPNSNTATVAITVNPVNDAPVAVADAFDAITGETLTVAAPGVLGNDSDIDGDALNVASWTAASAGSVSGAANGGFSFNAAGLAVGTTATFDYMASDGTLNSAPATVSITVVAPPANVAPVAIDDYAETIRGTSVDINVVLNDTDSDGTVMAGTVALTSTTTARGGTATFNGGGIVTYSPPNAGWRGTDTFTYTVQDDDGAVSNVATVTVNVIK